jgi:hypothetical protein
MRAQTAQLEAIAAERRTERELRLAFPYELAGADIDPQTRRAVFSAAPTAGVSLPAYKRLEEGLARNFPDWTIRVDPPRGQIPPIEFAPDSADLGEMRTQLAADLAWGLQRWGVTRVELVAILPTPTAAQGFNEASLGHRRASALAAELEKAGLQTEIVGEYRASEGTPADRAAAAQRTHQIFIRPVG